MNVRREAFLHAEEGHLAIAIIPEEVINAPTFLVLKTTSLRMVVSIDVD